jgi:hypothetical protein
MSILRNHNGASCGFDLCAYMYVAGGIGNIVQTTPSLIAVATYPRCTPFRWKSTGQIDKE